MRGINLLIAMMTITVSAALGAAILGYSQPKGPEVRITDIGWPETQYATISMEVTAYCYTGHRTASGTWPKKGTVAADTSVLPFGTKVYIPGYGVGTVEDRGGAIKGNRLDVYLPSERDAIWWGRKNVDVTILEWGA